MDDVQPQRKGGCSLRSVFICLLVAVGIAAALIFNLVHDLQTAERDVRAKHLEATTVIQRIYAYYNRTGKWPGEDVVEPWLPAGSAGFIPSNRFHCRPIRRCCLARRNITCS